MQQNALQRDESPIMDIFNREIAGVKRHIQQLLGECGLPCDDKTLSHLQHFLVMKKDDREVVGVVGLEPLPPAALIHSLAVQESYRRQGLASQLLEEIEAYARTAEYCELYLAAGKAADFFSQRGYHPLAKKDVPIFLHMTVELQTMGPDDVVYMHKALKSSDLKKEG
jgi:N-acetylglutamate synthase-like GNAT family acetyltransferase